MTQVLHKWENIFLNSYFSTVLPRDLFRAQPKVGDGAFLQ